MRAFLVAALLLCGCVQEPQSSLVRQATPCSHLVYLDFDGRDQVDIGFRTEDVPCFAGDKLAASEFVRSRLYEDFQWVPLVILTSEMDSEPVEPHIVMAFGGFDYDFWGLARCPNAIVYQPNPCVTELGNWNQIANVAAHELGHLMGLPHSDVEYDLMHTPLQAACIVDLDFAGTIVWSPED